MFILGFIIGGAIGVVLGCCMKESRLEELRDSKCASENFLKEMTTRDLENIFHEK